jgi:outer membrane lipoprotein
MSSRRVTVKRVLFRPQWLLVPVLVAVASGCAGPPRSLESGPASSPDPERVADNPSAFEGREVVWGGRIVSVTNEADVTRVSILAKPLDRRRRPDDAAEGGARFMARFDGFRDPLVYRSGRLITVVGRIQGTRRAEVGDYSYNHPVVAVASHELWELEPVRREPRYDPFLYPRHDPFHSPFIFHSPCFRHPRYCW